jgi:hypothetical protein
MALYIEHSAPALESDAVKAAPYSPQSSTEPLDQHVGVMTPRLVAEGSDVAWVSQMQHSPGHSAKE